jgi:uncharacterized protein (UPF0548 family)
LSELPLYQQYKARLDALRDLPLNFDLERRDQFTAANGWHVDDVQTELPPEPPGPPVPGGSFETARQILREYRFADPSIITGIFVPETPLEQRVMLLRGRAFGMNFWFGTKVGGVVDERRPAEGGEQQVWGFCYRTLKGHLERGEMTFTVIKWLATGQVAFHIHAFSQAGDITNPIIRLGFRLFGRQVQLRFVHNSLQRMRKLVEDELGHASHAEARRPGPPVVPAGASATATEKVEAIRQEEAGAASKQERSGEMSASDLVRKAPVEAEDVSRWLTFTSFWGSIFYLLSCVGIVAGSRRRPARLDGPTVGIGYLIHLATFVVGGSLVSFLGNLLRGKTSTQQAEEAIGGGALERAWPLQAVGGAAGAVVPFALAVASQAVAAQITGERTPADENEVSWPVAAGATVAATGLLALAVSRIVAWVAEDAKSGSRPRLFR